MGSSHCQVPTQDLSPEISPTTPARTPPPQVSHLQQPRTLSCLPQPSSSSPYLPRWAPRPPDTPSYLYDRILTSHKVMVSPVPSFPKSTLSPAHLGGFSGLSNGGISGPVATGGQGWGTKISCSLSVEASSWGERSLFLDSLEPLPPQTHSPAAPQPHLRCLGIRLQHGQSGGPHLPGSAPLTSDPG